MWKEADVRLCIYMIMYILCLRFILNKKLFKQFLSQGKKRDLKFKKKDFRGG